MPQRICTSMMNDYALCAFFDENLCINSITLVVQMMFVRSNDDSYNNKDFFQSDKVVWPGFIYLFFAICCVWGYEIQVKFSYLVGITKDDLIK